MLLSAVHAILRLFCFLLYCIVFMFINVYIINAAIRYYRVLTTLENLEISGNLLILENSGNLNITHGIYQMLFFVCIIVSNSTLNWFGDTVTCIDGASHDAL